MRRSALEENGSYLFPEIFPGIKNCSMEKGAIALVPAWGVSMWILDNMKIAVQSAFGEDVLLIRGPEGECDSPSCAGGQQAPASGFIRVLETLRADFDMVLGVVNIGLSHPGVNHVFGFTDAESRVSVMSLYHLGRKGDAPVKIARRASKTAIHELGHSYGLLHCRDHRCVMFFSFNLTDTDYKDSGFCEKCGKDLFARLKSGVNKKEGGLINER